jgi:hypothetical protein
MTEFRIETDSLGEVSVPADKLELRRHLTHCAEFLGLGEICYILPLCGRCVTTALRSDGGQR